MAGIEDMTKNERRQEAARLATQSMPSQEQIDETKVINEEVLNSMDIKPQKTYLKEIVDKVNAMPETEKQTATQAYQDWDNKKNYDPTNKPTQANEEIIAEIESENPVYETIGDRLRSSYGSDVNVQLGSDGKYYTGEGKNPIQISVGPINTTYKDKKDGLEKQVKSDVYKLSDGTYVYEDGNGDIKTLNEAQYQQAKQPTSDANRNAQSFREEAFRWLNENPNVSDSELWVYLADKLGKNAYAKERGLKFGNLFNWKNLVKELRADFQDEQQRKLNQERTISNELWDRDIRGNLIEGGVISIVDGKPKTIGEVNSLRRDLITFDESATPEEKAALLNKHLPADKQITVEEANNITDLQSAYSMLKTKGGKEFEEYMELGGVGLDADGNVSVQKPIDNLEEYLSEYNTKEKEKLELDRAKAKHNLSLRMEAFRDIAKNIGNTISVMMGANSLGSDNDNIYKNIEDKYREKVLAYEAKMEQMRQEKMAEKQRKEAMALQEAQMAASAQKAAADRELEMWKTMAKLNADRENAIIQANALKYAADKNAESKGTKDPFPVDKYIDIPIKGGKRLKITKNNWDRFISSKASELLGKYFGESDLEKFGITKSDNPTDAIEKLNFIKENAVKFGDKNQDGSFMYKQGLTKEMLEKEIDDILWSLNDDNSVTREAAIDESKIAYYRTIFPSLSDEQIIQMIN